MCHTHVCHKWLYHLDACAGVSLRRSTTSPMCKRDSATGRGRDSVNAVCVVLFWTPNSITEKLAVPLEATRRHCGCVHAVLGGLKLADPGITTEPRGFTEAQSGPADLFTIAAVPTRSAALDVSVAPPAAAARGDAVQAAFERKLNHNRHEIPEFLAQGILSRLLVCTADGRPHPAATRTLQYAADIVSSRNGQQMSAKSLQHRWKHEIQIGAGRQCRGQSSKPISRSRVASRWHRRQSSQSQSSSSPRLMDGSEEEGDTGQTPPHLTPP